MCICINCNFYNFCWIKNGLHKIPKNFMQSHIKALNNKSTNHSKILIDKTLFLVINLNCFSKKQKYEFDVIECEGFCEKPGYWLN